jgi:hypothetical protein
MMKDEDEGNGNETKRNDMAIKSWKPWDVYETNQ